MKKIISYSFLALCLIFSGCEKKFGEGVRLKGIEVESVLKLGMNQTGKAKAYPIPWDCTDYEFTWSSSNSEVAEVNEWGVVTAKSDRAAECTLTVSGGGFSKTIAVEIFKKTDDELFEETNVKHLFLFENASNLFQSSKGGVNLVPTPNSDPCTSVAGYNANKKAIRIPATRENDSQSAIIFNGLFLKHGIQANPSGCSRVNQFTILIDIKFSPRCCNYSKNPDQTIKADPIKEGPGPFLYKGVGTDGADVWSPGWMYGLYCVQLDPNSLDLTGNDMGFRWHDNGQFGVRDVLTTGNRLFQRDTWYRFVICVDMGVSIMYFKNGQKETTGTSFRSRDDSARAWLEGGVMFFAHSGGGNAGPLPTAIEAQEVDVATLAVWDRCLTENEARGLVVPDPDAFGVLLVP